MYKRTFAASVLLILAGCYSIPAGPHVAVMPGPGKPFDLFVDEDFSCRRFAEYQTGISPSKAQLDSTATGALTGTAVGAAAGTAIGAIAGNVGAGAIIGGGTGLLEGTAIGAHNGYANRWSVQQRYDIAYEQCMYAKGNQIPGVPLAYAMPSAPIPPPPPTHLTR